MSPETTPTPRTHRSSAQPPLGLLALARRRDGVSPERATPAVLTGRDGGRSAVLAPLPGRASARAATRAARASEPIRRRKKARASEPFDDGGVGQAAGLAHHLDAR